MKFIKWIVWDAHHPKLRIFTTAVVILSTIPWIMMSMIGWFQILR